MSMDRFLKPERLDVDPSSPTSSEQWKHWLATFENFLAALPHENLDKKLLLVNFVSPRIYSSIAASRTYEDAIQSLKSISEKPVNEIYTRHLLATRKQLQGESLDEFLRALNALAVACDCKAVTAVQYQEELVRDAFVRGIRSQTIRQRLLESRSVDLASIYELASVLDAALHSSENNNESRSFPETVAAAANDENNDRLSESPGVVAATRNPRCFFCGRSKHPRFQCPAREATCNECGKKGHYAKVCRSSVYSSTSASLSTITGATLASTAVALKASSILKLSNSLKTIQSSEPISMASSALSIKALGCITVDLKVQDRLYKSFRLRVLPHLCADVILGQDFHRMHESVTLNYGGNLPPLIICGLATLRVDPPRLFAHLSPDCRPIATTSRKFSAEDTDFIRNEVRTLLEDGVIEPSISPWRAQVVVLKDERRKKRLVVDYSATINRFTLLDAYPLPKIDTLVQTIAKYRVFSTIDLKSAYHQIPIPNDEKLYTAFEADGSLYQFTRIPFGVTNGVACFQRVINSFIKKEKLKWVVAYLDYVTVCGMSQDDHDKNLEQFLSAANRWNFTLNTDKCSFSTSKLRILGHEIENGNIRPDPLRDLPLPSDAKALRRVLGLSAYYSQWIFTYFYKIRPLIDTKIFPVSSEAKAAFEQIKSHIENSAARAVNENLPFELETDASDVAIAAVLNQLGRPVAFFSRTLQGPEKRYAVIEKEAQAIIEAIRHWKHYLTRRHFTIKTDQKSVSFMFSKRNVSKIKNDKIMRWKIELSCYDFDIIHRPGKDNVTPDALSRTFCSMASHDHCRHLQQLHDKLCHPGITRLYHFVRSKNLPYSIQEVRQVVTDCRTYAEMKPRFYQPETATSIKATQPFERLNIDFKGPLPGHQNQRYMFIVVDEYSRFPFAFPCADVSAASAAKCLVELYSLFGVPSYVHSDRGSAFASDEFRRFLLSKGIACSRTTPYNPQGNAQAERYTGTVWKTILLALKSQGLLTEQSIPAWLLDSKSALLKKHVRNSKTDPLVEEVRLLEVNPTNAYVRFPDGRESSVSTRHLAPAGSSDAEEAQQEVTAGDDCSENSEPLLQQNEEERTLRRSQRIRRPLNIWICDISLKRG
ncbi:Retrovirus-related Pol polyprotein from transposon 17.6 [Trichinella nativa]|uniref:Retrovirus-related Pol polyprotein from transposon 17.6 n=1 Tax=Trichinella nativa TaxID=6335 RepID=A0A0V1LKB0_9BILA|nr:Retrovirus-related Pol polyprotein from transposon 17.6 [Trichinella nativa]